MDSPYCSCKLTRVRVPRLDHIAAEVVEEADQKAGALLALANKPKEGQDGAAGLMALANKTKKTDDKKKPK